MTQEVTGIQTALLDWQDLGCLCYDRFKPQPCGVPILHGDCPSRAANIASLYCGNTDHWHCCKLHLSVCPQKAAHITCCLPYHLKCKGGCIDTVPVSVHQAVASQVSEQELERAKKATISSVLMNLESRAVVAEDIGRQVLTYGHRYTSHLHIQITVIICCSDIPHWERCCLETVCNLYVAQDCWQSFEDLLLALWTCLS